MVDNVITALNSDYMIAPNYWVDRKSGNDYYLTVQYFEHGEAAIHNMSDLGQIPLVILETAGGSLRAFWPAATRKRPAIMACGGQGRPTTVLDNVVMWKRCRRRPRSTMTRFRGRSMFMSLPASKIWASHQRSSEHLDE